MSVKKWQDGRSLASLDAAVCCCLDDHSKSKTAKEFNQRGRDPLFSPENVEVLVDRMNTDFSGKQFGNAELRDVMKEVLESNEKENGNICLKQI